jgi:excisionase family DNA binding protein
MKTQVPRQTYRIEEVAKMFGVGRNAAYEAAGRGEIPVIRLGKRLVAPRAAINRMLGIDPAERGQ